MHSETMCALMYQPAVTELAALHRFSTKCSFSLTSTSHTSQLSLLLTRNQACHKKEKDQLAEREREREREGGGGGFANARGAFKTTLGYMTAISVPKIDVR